MLINEDADMDIFHLVKSSIFDDLSDSILILDENLKIKSYNNSFNKVFNPEIKEIFDLDDLSIPTTNLERWKAKIKIAINKRKKVSFISKIKLGNNLNSFDIAIKPVFGDNDKLNFILILKKIIDIETEKKYISNFVYLLDNSPDAIWTIEQDMSISIANTSASKLLKQETQSIIGKSFSEINNAGSFIYEIIDNYKKLIDKYENNDYSSIREERNIFNYVLANDKNVWLDCIIVPIIDNIDKHFSIMTIARDVTVLKNQERQFEDLKVFHEEMVSNLPIGIIRLSQDGLILYQNDLISKLFGIDELDKIHMIGMDFTEIDGIVNKPWVKELKRFIPMKKILYHQELPTRKGDG